VAIVRSGPGFPVGKCLPRRGVVGRMDVAVR
jgi:hypothetical protein